MQFFGILQIPPFIQITSLISSPLTDQWDEQSILGQFHKGRMKGDDPKIDTVQTTKCLDERLTLLEKIHGTFTDSISNKETCEQNNIRPSHRPLS